MISYRISVSYDYRIAFTRDVFSPTNLLFREMAPPSGGNESPRMMVVVDAAVAHANPALTSAIERYCREHSLALVAAPVIVDGGEAAKNSRERLDQLLERIHRHGLCRHSYLVAIGGGALLDLAGLAASLAHRGLRLIRLPTTTLSQGDGGVGVKNGINSFGKKNFLGTFAVPWAVINDLQFLNTLPPMQRRAGFAEAVKVAAIRDPEFFAWLESHADKLARFEPDAVEHAVRRSAELHARHIATSGDPFEIGTARPLDFGHWAAHKLEQLADFRLSHGDAVAIGVALDSLYSERIGLLPPGGAARMLALLENLGFTLFDPALQLRDAQHRPRVLEGLREFQEHLGGELTITLLAAIGQGREVHAVDETVLLGAIDFLLARAQLAGAA